LPQKSPIPIKKHNLFTLEEKILVSFPQNFNTVKVVNFVLKKFGSLGKCSIAKDRQKT
jgi:hypothetical protein